MAASPAALAALQAALALRGEAERRKDARRAARGPSRSWGEVARNVVEDHPGAVVAGAVVVAVGGVALLRAQREVAEVGPLEWAFSKTPLGRLVGKVRERLP